MSMTREQRIELYKRVFVDNPDGVLVLEDLAGLHYDREVFDAESDRKTAFNCGQRAVVGRIIGLLGQTINAPEDDEHDD